jgi:hypothetical protein
MSDYREVRLRIGPYVSHDLTVHFEPTGATYELLAGDWFDVTVRGHGSGLIEIGHTPTALIVGAWADSEAIVEASDGRALVV